MHSVTSNAVSEALQSAINGTIKKHIYLRASDDLNNLSDGIYYYENGDTPQNGYGANAFIVQITARSNLVIQFCYEFNSGFVILRHTDFYGAWQGWNILHSGI